MQNMSTPQVPLTKAPLTKAAALPDKPAAPSQPPQITAEGGAKTMPELSPARTGNPLPTPQGFDQSREGKDLLRRLEEYQVKEMRRRLDSDLSDIKAAYPDVSAKDVGELGELYLSIMKAGGVDAVSAFEAQMLSARRKRKETPPAIGAVNTSGTREKDFYSPNEVDRLTDQDFDKNPKLLSLVLKSMTKWK